MYDSQIEQLFIQARENHRVSRDSLDYYLSRILEFDTLQLSNLSLARIHHVKGLYYETLPRYDSATYAFSYGASLLSDNYYKCVLLLRAGTVAARANQFESYNNIMNKAEKLVNKLDDPVQEASFYATKGEYYMVIDNYESAIVHLTKADSILEANDIIRSRDYYCYRLGFSYRRLSKYPEAFKYFEKSIDLSTQLNNVALLAGNYLDLSRMYRNSQRFDEALELQEKHLDLVYEIKDMMQIQRGLENMGIIYTETEQWDKAESYFLNSLEAAYEINDNHSIGDALSNVGSFYYRKGDIDNAYNYYKQSYNYRLDNNGNPISILSSLFHLGDVDVVKKDYASAEANLKKAVFLADSVHQTKWVVSTTQRLADLYKLKGNYYKYAEVLEEYIDAKDKLNSELQNTNFNKLMVQYETKQKEMTIALQLEQLKTSRHRQIIIGISFLFLLTFTIALFINKKVRMRTFRAIYRQQLLVNDQRKVINSLLKKTKELKLPDVENVLLSNLKDLLEVKEIYRNPEVSLEMVAKELGTNITYASQLVNNEFNCNFKTLINRYRIAYCKECIKNSNAKDTMKSLGLQAGFKSQSAFYACFKDSVGMTPLQFAKVSKIESSVAV